MSVKAGNTTGSSTKVQSNKKTDQLRKKIETLARTQHYRQTQPLIQKALEIDMANRNFKGIMLDHWWNGFVKLVIGEPYQAIQSMEKAIQLARKTGFVERIAGMQVHLGSAYIHVNRNEKAHEVLEKASEYLAAKKNWVGLSNAKEMLGRLYLEKGQLAEAEKIRTDLREIAKASGKPGIQAAHDSFSGSFHAKKGELDEAETVLNKYLQWIQAQGREVSIAQTLAELADIQLKNQQWKKAITSLQKAQKHLKKVEAMQVMLQVDKLFGEAYLSAGILDKAEVSFKNALSKSIEMRDLSMEISVLESLRSLEQNRHHYGKAYRYSEMVMEKFQIFLKQKQESSIRDHEAYHASLRSKRLVEINRRQNQKLHDQSRKITDQAQRLKSINLELKMAREQARELERLLPICANCKKIRDDSGYWEEIESFVTRSTGITIERALCPNCRADEAHEKRNP